VRDLPGSAAHQTNGSCGGKGSIGEVADGAQAGEGLCGEGSGGAVQHGSVKAGYIYIQITKFT